MVRSYDPANAGPGVCTPLQQSSLALRLCTCGAATMHLTHGRVLFPVYAPIVCVCRCASTERRTGETQLFGQTAGIETRQAIFYGIWCGFRARAFLCVYCVRAAAFLDVESIGVCARDKSHC